MSDGDGVDAMDADRGEISILVAEDERRLRDEYEKLFESCGFFVRTVGDGVHAVEAFRTQPPDVVILDVMMPILDGYATCREIRKLDREVPILFLSALDRDEDQISGLEAGADDYVSKTASVEMLVARVKSAIARSKRLIACEAPSNLTKTEANIYRLLKTVPGKIFSYREIFAAIVGEGYYADEGSLRSHISHLRKKLPRGVKIEARRGQGFCLT